MRSYAYEQLSAQDNMFLVTETPETPMHIAAVMILESGPMKTAEGGIDIGRYKQAIEGILHKIPRYRQKVRSLPMETLPVWVDDPHFSIDYHIRHTSLPRPGTIEQLKALSSRVISHPLDPSRPLWEMWVVEGLEGGDQFAIVSKIHHCMIDGSAGADLSQILMSPDPNAGIEAPVPYYPRPAPSTGEFLADELKRSLTAPFRAAGALTSLVREVLSDPNEAIETLKVQAAAMGEFAESMMNPCSDTPLNGTVGPHRSFDWLTMPLDDVKEVKSALGCTVNDLVLSAVSGAVRRYMEMRRVDPNELDFRVMAPVNIRQEADKGKLGNHVASWVVPLPVDEADAAARVSKVCETTKGLKKSNAALGAELMMSSMGKLPSSVMASTAALAAVPINTVVTNVPGPPFPLYVLGARLLGTYPVVPLVAGCGLGIALFSYDGRLCWGFNADPALVPDLDRFVRTVRDSFEELRTLAVKRSLKPKRRRVHKRPAPELKAVEDQAFEPTAEILVAVGGKNDPVPIA
jgi:WS/DGAT/MGAT family acyltransferase